MDNSIKKKGRAETIDIYVGERLKEIRKMQKITQEALAGKIGVSFQQIQKYENGKNRISVGRLHDISNILKVPLNAFIEGFSNLNDNSPAYGLSDNAQQQGLEGQPLPPKKEQESQNHIPKKEIDELIHVYYQLDDPKLRKSFLSLGKNMVENIKDQDS